MFPQPSLREIARNPDARVLFTQYIKDMLSVLSEKLASAAARQGEARAEALRMFVEMLGAVILARAVDDKTLSDEILARTHADLCGALRHAGRARNSRPTGSATHRRRENVASRRPRS